jgi:hypothetical protein
VTRYELFRKRIAPILFLGVVGLIAYDAWKKEKDAAITGTVVLDFGEAAPRVREVEAQMFVRGRPIENNLRCVALTGMRIGDCRFQARMPEPDGELRISIDLGDARRQLKRGVHLEPGGTLRVELGPELARPAR